MTDQSKARCLPCGSRELTGCLCEIAAYLAGLGRYEYAAHVQAASEAIAEHETAHQAGYDEGYRDGCRAREKQNQDVAQ